MFSPFKIKSVSLKKKKKKKRVVILIIKINQRRAVKYFFLVKRQKLTRKAKKIVFLYAEVAKAYSKSESSLREIVKKEKETCAGFAVTSHTARAMATVCGKCLI